MGAGASVHRPVLLAETIEALAPRDGGRYIDANLGGGGHAEAILERSAPGGRLLGIDADAGAIAGARDRLARFGDRLQTFHGSSARLAEAADRAGFPSVDGVLFDLGISSDQLVDRERGFGIRAGGRLDLRFDVTRGEPASSVIAALGARELAGIFRQFGDEPHAMRIARAIVAQRVAAPIDTAELLAALVERSVPAGRPTRIHPATRVFQALRIYVNDELQALEVALVAAIDRLAAGGRVAVLTYHSLEDRIVKRAFATAVRGCICPPKLPTCACGIAPTLRLVTKRAILPGEAELHDNPRSRSAKLRAAERLAVAA